VRTHGHGRSDDSPLRNGTQEPAVGSMFTFRRNGQTGLTTDLIEGLLGVLVHRVTVVRGSF
jgi:hypothetical protein